MNDRYQALEVEAEWQRIWEEKGLYEIDLKQALDSKQPKFYAFAMFAYPSGDGIHVGHVRNFVIADVLLRRRRQQGDWVYAPVGFDSFGLPAENFALKSGRSPQETIAKATVRISEQYRACGLGFDWSKMINTSQADYYKWTQWCFLRLFKDGLAYRKGGWQWWCQACRTILADEQVINGKCWRHDAKSDPSIGRKNLKQWFFAITEYADEILEATPDLAWTEWVKAAQINYIGRSEGSEIEFSLQGLSLKQPSLKVFTTAIETLYGATFMVLAPEHPLVEELLEVASNRGEIETYVRLSQAKTEVARQQAGEKTGVCVAGLEALNPLTGLAMSVWVADYVLVNYGTGAIMAVPGADERDLAFAEAHDLGVVYPTQAGEFVTYKDIASQPEKHFLASPDRLDGLDMAKAKEAILKKLKSQKVARSKVNYKLRDWLVSRQRYWGTPIPIVFCQACGPVAVKEEDLPVILPVTDDYQPAGDGRSPLARLKDWVKTDCPACERPAKRETDTLDTYVCSAWYQMRYLSPHDETRPWSTELTDRWFPVDFYNGGDHVTAHLLYARFMTRFFYKKRLLPTPEPFKQMYFHAKIKAADGQAFSKSRGGAPDPLEIINKGYGADALRLYICAAAPPNAEIGWNPAGVPAAYAFLNRAWTLVGRYLKNRPAVVPEEMEGDADILRAAHGCAAKVSRDIGRLKYNTAVAAQMELVNLLYAKSVDGFQDPAWRPALEFLAMLLAPFAPHLASELWRQLGHSDSVHVSHWPQVDERYLIPETIVLPVQVNGKLRGRLEIAAGTSEEEVLRRAKELAGVARHLPHPPKKELYIAETIVSFVV